MSTKKNRPKYAIKDHYDYEDVAAEVASVEMYVAYIISSINKCENLDSAAAIASLAGTVFVLSCMASSDNPLTEGAYDEKLDDEKPWMKSFWHIIELVSHVAKPPSQWRLKYKFLNNGVECQYDDIKFVVYKHMSASDCFFDYHGKEVSFLCPPSVYAHIKEVIQKSVSK